MEVKEIEAVLQTQSELKECPESLLADIASQLHRPLNRQYQEMAKSIFLQASGTGTSADRRKTFGELQEKVSGLWTNARLFEKGLNMFRDADQANLARHLLKTICTDITNLLVCALATEHMLTAPEDGHLTTEGRLKLIGSLPRDVQVPLSKMHLCLNGQNLDDFFTHMEQLCSSSHLSIMLKKPDKKKERQLVFAHRQTLAEQLRSEADSAMALHLAAVMLFQTFTQAMVHAPGKMVPNVLLFLKESMDAEKHASLTQMQDLIVQRLHAESKEDKHAVDTLKQESETLLPTIKDIALTTKRTTPAQEEQ